MEHIKFKTVNYRAGAYVYVEEQADSGEFYIIRSGKLIEDNPLNELTGEDDLILEAGDFFGVLDCMSRRPHVSSIRVLEDTSLIVIRYDQFEVLIKQMSPIAIKIIRYFSNRLRKYNETIAQLTFQQKPQVDTPCNLLEVAEYYRDNGQSNLAGYAYTKYLELCRNINNPQSVHQQLEQLNFNIQDITPSIHGIQETFQNETPIFIEMEEGKDLYIILDGQVKITKVIQGTEILLGIMKAKDIFGEMAILENTPRSASAIASGMATVLRINKNNFETHIKTHPEIARRIIELLSDRIWLVNKRLANQLITDPVTKIYDALQTLLQKNHIPLQKGLNYVFEMSPEEILQFIGLDTTDGKKIINQILTNDPALDIKDGKLCSRDVYNIRSAMTLSGRFSSQPKKRTHL